MNEPVKPKIFELPVMLGVSRPNRRFMDANPEERCTIVNVGVLALYSIEVSLNTEANNKRNEYLESVIAQLHADDTRLVEERAAYVERLITKSNEKGQALSDSNKEKTESPVRHTNSVFESVIGSLFLKARDLKYWPIVSNIYVALKKFIVHFPR